MIRPGRIRAAVGVTQQYLLDTARAKVSPLTVRAVGQKGRGAGVARGTALGAFRPLENCASV
ncbi:MAG TPA: hypothetical protein VFU38_08180 [Candidatus Krumholzibacteria bacterium]|nr:hypothetical protein [Candidatus Krumholzibacteria bacterium]